MGKLRMPYLYHQSVILAHYEAEKRSYEGHLNEGHPRIRLHIKPKADYLCPVSTFTYSYCVTKKSIFHYE